MHEDRNQSQIIRKDAKNCFVESLSDAFDKGKAHFAFATYDVNKPSGQRQTNNVHIYISIPELLNLCLKLTSGELRFIWQERKKTGDGKPIVEWLGGTSAEKLRQYGKPRPDGKSLSRVCKLMAAQKFDFLFVADSGPGETDSKGLIVPRFGNKIKELEKKQDMLTMMEVWFVVRVVLYLQYDTSEDFLPQFKFNAENLLQLLDDIPKLKGMVNRGRGA